MYWFAFLNRLSKEWTVVSKGEAQQNPYFGFRGWLLLLYLLAVVGLIQNLIVVFASPDPDLVEIFGGNPDVMRGVYVVYGIVWAPFLVLAPLRNSLTPKVWIGGAWVSVVVYAAAVNMPGRLDAMIGQIAIGVVVTLLMTWYVLHSKRVNVTYLSRVPAEEATKQPQSLPIDHAWKYSRIGWIVVGIVGVILLLKLLQLVTSR